MSTTRFTVTCSVNHCQQRSLHWSASEPMSTKRFTIACVGTTVNNEVYSDLLGNHCQQRNLQWPDSEPLSTMWFKVICLGTTANNEVYSDLLGNHCQNRSLQWSAWESLSATKFTVTCLRISRNLRSGQNVPVCSVLLCCYSTCNSSSNHEHTFGVSSTSNIFTRPITMWLSSSRWEEIQYGWIYKKTLESQKLFVFICFPQGIRALVKRSATCNGCYALAVNHTSKFYSHKDKLRLPFNSLLYIWIPVLHDHEIYNVTQIRPPCFSSVRFCR